MEQEGLRGSQMAINNCGAQRSHLDALACSNLLPFVQLYHDSFRDENIWAHMKLRVSFWGAVNQKKCVYDIKRTIIYDSSLHVYQILNCS